MRTNINQCNFDQKNTVINYYYYYFSITRLFFSFEISKTDLQDAKKKPTVFRSKVIDDGFFIYYCLKGRTFPFTSSPFVDTGIDNCASSTNRPKESVSSFHWDSRETSSQVLFFTRSTPLILFTLNFIFFFALYKNPLEFTLFTFI